MEWIIWIAVCFIITSDIRADSSVYECVKTTSVIARKVSIRYGYQCGWFGWQICTGIRYYIDYNEIKICCDGYEMVDGRCVQEHHTAVNTDCGRSSEISSLIVGGTNATLMEYPWLVYLNMYGYGCGGALIGSYWILTAAHCFKHKDGGYRPTIKITLGELNRRKLEGHEITLGAERFFIHPGYNTETLHNDIALIKASQKVAFNDYVKPICLPQANLTLHVDDEVEIAGWGRTGTHEPAADVLKKSKMEIANISDCIQWAIQMYPKQQICVKDTDGNHERGSCYGDSGGPLMLRRKNVVTAVGITSFGSSVGCANGNPVVYTDVRAYVDWIEDTMKNN